MAVHQHKERKINQQFDEAKAIYRDPSKVKEKVEQLKANSSLRTLCLAIQEYLHGRHYQGCVAAYRLYHLAPHKRPKDLSLVELIKKRMRTIREKTALQLELFPAP